MAAPGEARHEKINYLPRWFSVYHIHDDQQDLEYQRYNKVANQAKVDPDACEPWDIPAGARSGSVCHYWYTRYQFIKGICEGQHVRHFDLEPSNINLLDSGMIPKIAAFGLSSLFSPGTDTKYDDRKVGSIGFMAPEFMKKGLLSTKYDVFSLGKSILRLITGKRCSPLPNGEYGDYYKAIQRRPLSRLATEIHALLQALHDGQTTKRHSRYTRESCTDALASKGDHASPYNDRAIGSSEKGVVSQPSLCLNGSVETPIHQPDGGLISSGGPDHPEAADNSSITPNKTLELIWLVASTATHHMTGDVNQLRDYTPTPGHLVVHVPNMGPMLVHGSGTLSTETMSLQNVLYLPGLDKNLVSTSQLAKLGYTITLGPSGCRITKDDEDQTLVGNAHFTDDYLFELDFLRVPSSTN